MWIRTIIGFFFAFHSCNCENFTNPSSVSIDLLNRPYLKFDENTNTNTCRKSEREKKKTQNRFKWIRHISSMHNGRQGSLVDEITRIKSPSVLVLKKVSIFFNLPMRVLKFAFRQKQKVSFGAWIHSKFPLYIPSKWSLIRPAFDRVWFNITF